MGIAAMMLSSTAGGGGGGGPVGILGGDLWLWLKRGEFYTDAGSTPAVSNGDQIYRWKDMSGNSRHFDQTTSANRPTLATGTTFNGVAGADCDGTVTGGQFWTGPSLNGLTDAEVWLSLKVRNQPPAVGQSGLWTNFGTDNDVTVYPASGDGNIYINFGTARQTTGIGTGLTLTNAHVLNVHTDPDGAGSATWQVIIGNAVQYSNGALGSGSFPVGNAALGISISGSGIRYDGWFFEMVVASRVTNSTDRNALYTYMTT